VQRAASPATIGGSARGGFYDSFINHADTGSRSGGSVMDHDDKRSAAGRRSGRERRSGADTRSEADKRLIGDRRSNSGRRSGFDRRAHETADVSPIGDRRKP
jgi:hypothetical protein